MKYKVQILNYESKWVDYTDYSSKYWADCAVADLKERHNFEGHQIKILKK